MSPLLVLPIPLPSSSIALGQLVTDPLYGESPSLKPTSVPAHKEAHVQSKYEDTVAHDDFGRFTSTRFISRLSGQPHYSHENLLLLNAEQMSHITIDRPAAVFDRLHQDPATRSFLRRMAFQNKPVYFVTGLQTLKKPTFKRAVVEHGLVAEAKKPHNPLPRRVDSAQSLDGAAQSEDSVLAVELMKVKCRIGSSSEPHSVEDLEYHWSYTRCDQNPDMQLSIGLGKALQATELRGLAGIHGDDDSDGAYSSYNSSDSEDGFGGFEQPFWRS